MLYNDELEIAHAFSWQKQEDDVLPSKREKEAREREMREYLKIKQKRYRLEYSFDSEHAAKQLTKFQALSNFSRLAIRNRDL